MNQTIQASDKMQRVVVYCRVSTAMQSNNGHSLGQQESACRAYVQLQKRRLQDGFSLDIWKETTSGSIDFAKREIGREIFGLLKSGDWLVCSRLDRCFRSAKDCLWVVDELKKRGVEVHLLDLQVGELGCCVTNGIGHMFMTIMSAVAQFEREKIGERTRDVKQQRLADGFYVGGKVKWGMQVAVDGKFVEDEQKAQLIAKMKTWRRAGKSLRDIKERIRKLGESISVDTVRSLTLDVTSAEHRKRGRRKKVA